MRTLLLLLFSANWAYMSIARNLCTNLMPGLDLLLKGVDITELDMLPNDIKADNSFGYRRPILEYTCDKQALVYMEGNEYQRPDQILHIEMNPFGETSTTVEKISNANEVDRNYNVGVGGSVAYQGVSFGASASYSEKTSENFKEEGCSMETGSFQSATTAFLLPNWALNIHKEAELDINRTLIGQQSLQAYETFIAKYGTHYFSNGKFGGYLKVISKKNKTEHQSQKTQEWKKSVEVGIAGILSVKAEDTTTETTTTTNNEETKTLIKKFYGGQAKLIDDGKGFGDWQKTVNKNPWLISGDLTPITDLIKDDLVKRIMETHVDQHVLRAHVKKLKMLWGIAKDKALFKTEEKCKPNPLEHLTGTLVRENVDRITSKVYDCVLKLQTSMISCPDHGLNTCGQGGCFSNAQRCDGNMECKIDKTDEDPDICDNCYVGDDASSYKGPVSKTVDGDTCKTWSSYWLANDDEENFDKNYCRSVKGSNLEPWCFTTSWYRGWNFCDVVKCSSHDTI